MTTFSISRRIKWQGTMTDRVVDVCRMFGLTIDRLTNQHRDHTCRLEVNPGDIVYITGASGTGKSILLKEFEKCIPASDRINLAHIDLPSDKTLVDYVQGDLLTSLRFLSVAGLNDCFCILNRAGSATGSNIGSAWRWLWPHRNRSSSPTNSARVWTGLPRW
jgi:energy-coupling factor transporter ATP-binding protein EcfA2